MYFLCDAMSCGLLALRHACEDSEFTRMAGSDSFLSPLSDFACDGPEELLAFDDEEYQVDDYGVPGPSGLFGSAEEEDIWYSDLAVRLARAALADDLEENDVAMDAVIYEIANAAVITAFVEEPPQREVAPEPAVVKPTEAEAAAQTEPPRRPGQRGAARRQQRILAAELALDREKRISDCVHGLLNVSISNAVGHATASAAVLGPQPFAAVMAAPTVSLPHTRGRAKFVPPQAVSTQAQPSTTPRAKPIHTLKAEPRGPVEAAIARPASRSFSALGGMAEPGEFDRHRSSYKKRSKRGKTPSAPLLAVSLIAGEVSANGTVVSSVTAMAEPLHRKNSDRRRSSSRSGGVARQCEGPKQHRRPQPPAVVPVSLSAPTPPAAPPPVALPARRPSAFFCMDLADSSGEQRESSLVRGYEALGVELYSLDGASGVPPTPSSHSVSAHRGAPSAMEMDLGACALTPFASPAFAMEKALPRATSLGVLHVTKSMRGGQHTDSHRTILLGLPPKNSGLLPALFPAPLHTSKAPSYLRASDPMMTFSLGSSKARWGSISSVF